MSKHFDAEKMLHTQKYKLILVCIWTAILVLCFLNREHFTVNGVLEYTPENPILAAAFMMFLFALKSLSVFIFSGFLFIANGILFPLPSAIMLNVLGACIMISLPYWVGKQVGKGVIDHIVRKYPKAEALKGIRTNHDFIFSFVTRAINILPSDILSLYMGAIGTGYKEYLAGSILEMLLPVITYPIMGTNITNPKSPAFLISLGIQVLVSAISIGSYCLYRKKKQGGTAYDEAQNH